MSEKRLILKLINYSYCTVTFELQFSSLSSIQTSSCNKDFFLLRLKRKAKILTKTGNVCGNENDYDSIPILNEAIHVYTIKSIKILSA